MARSSKAAKMGRYPPVPHVDTHPLSRHARERAATDEDTMDVASLCASWRQRAGKPGAAVTLEVERMLRNDDDDAAAAADASPSSVTLVDPDASSPHWRLLLTNKNENLYNAFALEVAACAPNSVGLATGLFASASTPAAPTLARMAGLRAVVDPLATGEDLASLLRAVRALPIAVPPLPNGAPTPVALYHDCVARFVGGDTAVRGDAAARASSPDVYASVGDVVRTWTPCGFKHGVYARFKNPNDPTAVEGLRDTLRFVVIETSRGYVFGLTTFAPAPPPPRCDWNRKPNNYSAGTRPEVAAAALNAVLAGGEGMRGSTGGRGDEGATGTASVVVDPCCGGGTILHAAWSRGYAAIGGDVNAQIVLNARGNIASFVPSMPAAHAVLAALDEVTSKDEVTSEDEVTSGLLAPPPRIHEADATSQSTNWVANASAWLGRRPDSVGVAAVVSNLPFGRNMSVGGKGGGGKWCTADADAYVPLLTALLPVAPRHAFVSGTPIAETMRACGYENVCEVPVCRFGRIFLAVAMGADSQWPRGPLRPAVNFTTEQATGAKATRGYVRNPDPEWVEAMGGSVAMGGSRRSAKPPLRIAIDTGYDQDSQRAVRSVAKQLAECIGVKRRALKVEPSAVDTEPTPVDVDLTFAGWRGVVAAHAADHFNADRWSEVRKDPRDVEDIFMRGGDGGDDNGEDGVDGKDPEGGAPAKVVYLSPDAEEVLEDVEPGVVYVIGGIVDLAARGVAWSLPKANALGACARRLPVREHLPLVTNQILNIDTAMKVLCERYSGKEWGDALRAALPRRQQGERPARFNRPRTAGYGDGDGDVDAASRALQSAER